MSKLRILHLALNESYQENPITRAMNNSGAVAYEIEWKKKIVNMPVFNRPMFWDSVLSAVKMMRPNIVFLQLEPGFIDPEIAYEMSKISFVVNWTGDVRNDMGWMKHLSMCVSLSLFTNTNNVEEFRAAGLKADYLQVGFDENVYLSIEQLEKKSATVPGDFILTASKYSGIVFLGNNFVGHENNFPLSYMREEMINRMKSEFGSVFKYYGGGWGPDIIPLLPEQEALCYRSCDIAINLSHYNYGRYSSDRLLRIMASGALAMTHRYPGIEDDYTDGKNVIIWDDVADLIDKCVFYMRDKNKSLRKKIAAAGCELVHKLGTWEYRMKQLYSMVEKYNPEAMIKNDNWIDGLKTVSPTRVHSQYGEEGYLGYIFNCLGTTNKFFVDFGAGDGFSLSNTRLFAEQYGWTGLMMDADNHGNNEVKKHFINAENIVSLLQKYNVPEHFDLLSIDMDGNDYWILSELLEHFTPRVIIAEFNGTIPADESKTIEYNPDHVWGNNDYYGFSMQAGKVLAKERGYVIIHQTNSTNIYLVHASLLADPDAVPEIPYEVMQYHAKSVGGAWRNIS